jgi:chemotaxis methyl-accepting protein methylase
VHPSLLPPLPTDDPDGFAALLAKVSRERGFGCASYKERCLRRRIAVRMRATGTHTFADYAHCLDADPREYERLLDALTINVTKLFRNAEAWEALAERAVPELWARVDGPLRVWSAGCASGEEAYSLAALFHRHAERAGELDRLSRVTVLATDIDAASLELAREGQFADAAFADTPPALRERYFVPAPEHAARPGVPRLAAIPELRRLVRPARHDLLGEAPPPGPWHLIACRNVVIYFEREAQEALFARLHDALAPGGLLFLGKVETVLGPVRQRFVAVEQRERIFRRT